MKAGIKPIQIINKKAWIKCPICELNFMHEGEDRCSVCPKALNQNMPIFIDEKNRVTLWEIC